MSSISSRGTARTRASIPLRRSPTTRASMVSVTQQRSFRPRKMEAKTARQLTRTRRLRLRLPLPAAHAITTPGPVPHVPPIPTPSSPGFELPSAGEPVPSPLARRLRPRKRTMRRTLPGASAVGAALVRAGPAVVLRRDHGAQRVGGAGGYAASAGYAWVLWREPGGASGPGWISGAGGVSPGCPCVCAGESPGATGR